MISYDSATQFVKSYRTVHCLWQATEPPLPLTSKIELENRKCRNKPIENEHQANFLPHLHTEFLYSWFPISFPVLSDSYRSIALAIHPPELVLPFSPTKCLLRPTLNESSHCLNQFSMILHNTGLSRHSTAGIRQSFTKAPSLNLSINNMLDKYIYYSHI